MTKLSDKNSMQKRIDVSFEIARENQAALLVAFENRIAEPKLYGKPLDFKGAIHEIRNNHYYFIKNKKNELIGTAAYRIREDKSCYISNVAVATSYRGRGIARIAMEFLLKQCSDAGRIDLVTHPENCHAISLYESLGFVTELYAENYFGDGEPRFIMAKKLNEKRSSPYES